MAEKKEQKGKEGKKKKPFNRQKMYNISGDKIERKNKACPKCGKESYLANHKDRLSCGKCGYVEVKQKA
ncbi:30S ribosomal protein S27ae [Candidatus Woesearchaeota archaeon]|nr:30S ribosomal protein S27ae [Candidatus Woesearchaeota archaeon]